MTDERWAEIAAWFHSLADQGTAMREERLRELATSHPEVVAELRSLLAADANADALPSRVALRGAELDVEPAAPVVGDRIGPYEIRGELGRGGMGVVYRAARVDGAFDREVAIKLARPDLGSPAVGARFAAERRLLAALDHPGIARLLDAGSREDGSLYLVMELVEGERLDQWAAGQPLARRLAVFEAVAEAVDHAHRNLILHRDLKPSNVLVDGDGRPKLLDFGIARLLADDPSAPALTQLGLRAMTPEYASPEQLRGEALTAASDVFALGVVLFELLTGEPPYPAASTTSPEERAARIETATAPRASAVADRRRAGDPQSAASSRRALRGDLDAIVAKALAADPAARYTAVADLLADLRCYRERRPIRARPPSWRDRTAKFLRRNRVAVAAGMVIAVSLLGATAISLSQARRASAERDRFEHQLADTRRLANTLLSDIHDAIARVPGAVRGREILLATGLEYLEKLAPEAAGDPDLERELARGYARMAGLLRSHTLPSLGKTMDSAAAYEASVTRWEALVNGPHARPTDAFELTGTLRRRAETEFSSGRPDLAATSLERAVELLAGSDVAAPEGAWLELERASAGAELGYYLAAAGHLDRGLAGVREAAERMAVLGDPHADLRLGRATENLLARTAEIEANAPGLGFAAAVATRERGVALARHVYDQLPNDAIARGSLAAHLAMLGSLYSGLDRDFEAVDAFTEADQLLADQIAADPADQQARRMRENLRLRRAYLELRAGRPAVAHELASAALDALAPMRQADPADAALQLFEANAHHWLGAAIAAQARATGSRRDWEAARTALRSAHDLFRALIDSGAIIGGEARQADRVVERLAECDRALAP